MGASRPVAHLKEGPSCGQSAAWRLPERRIEGLFSGEHDRARADRTRGVRTSPVRAPLPARLPTRARRHARAACASPLTDRCRVLEQELGADRADTPGGGADARASNS